MREASDDVDAKIRRMPTDPARARRTDAGDPGRCPVWQWHLVYTDEGVHKWVQEGCRSAGIGCVDCKKPLIEAVQAELEPIRLRAAEYTSDPDLVKSIVAEGNERARDAARQTLEEVRESMGLAYR